MRKEIRLLDVGCGVGRVAIGILTSSQQVHLYHGVAPQGSWTVV